MKLDGGEVLVTVVFHRDMEDVELELLEDPKQFDQRLPLEVRAALQLSEELQEAYDRVGIGGTYEVPELAAWMKAHPELATAQRRLRQTLPNLLQKTLQAYTDRTLTLTQLDDAEAAGLLRSSYDAQGQQYVVRWTLAGLTLVGDKVSLPEVVFVPAVK